MKKLNTDVTSKPSTKPAASGLTGDESSRRMETSGPNAMPDTALNPLNRSLSKLWEPVPWML